MAVVEDISNVSFGSPSEMKVGKAISEAFQVRIFSIFNLNKKIRIAFQVE
jgi:hypothetical protein